MATCDDEEARAPPYLDAETPLLGDRSDQQAFCRTSAQLQGRLSKTSLGAVTVKLRAQKCQGYVLPCQVVSVTY